MMNYFVDVVVPLAVPNTFTYETSKEAFDVLQAGCRVMVPFGKKATYTALVVHKHHNKPLIYTPKPIFEVLDVQPVVAPLQLQLWYWMAEYYMCTLGEVYRAAMPSNMLLESETVIVYQPEVVVALAELNDQEYLVYEAFQRQSVLKLQEIKDLLNTVRIAPVLQGLADKGMIKMQEEMIDTYQPKVIQYIRLASRFEADEQLQNLLEEVGKSEKQKHAVLSYFQHRSKGTQTQITSKQLVEESGVSASSIKTLIKKEIFEVYTQTQDRMVFDHAHLQLQLSQEQTVALQEIQQSFLAHNVCLLHGVTGSGKTEIYIALIATLLKQKKQVLYLLPEIALTTQLVQRLTAHFGNQVAVYHSKYSLNERREVWKQLNEQSEKAQVVIGARSAVFLPFTHLGLVVIDEEHEASYKQQDPAPRYHARDTAIVLAQMHQAKVVLGSATPSLETYYNAYQEKFGKVVLNKRFGKSHLPDIELIDLKENYKRKQMVGHFSMTLLDAMQQTLQKKEQVILFQNRRGFSPVLECKSCGHVPHCTSCDVSLTYYKIKDQLKCHYCGFTIAKPIRCPQCNSLDVSTKGFGTEQIEIELKALLPEYHIARMDQDTTRGKFAFEKLLDAFKNKEIDVLIGTQMLAKGLDFENVTLVGVLNADNALYFPDFRANERAFQMLLQVAGRAGRSDKKGKVLIQTYNPYHSIIQQVLQNDYTTMFKEQMYERLQFHYPPFYRLVRLQLRHVNYEKVKEGAFWLYQALQAELQMPVLGPEEPAISRIRNKYIRVILIKIPVKQSLRGTKARIQKKLQSFESIAAYRSIQVTINVDYY